MLPIFSTLRAVSNVAASISCSHQPLARYSNRPIRTYVGFLESALDSGPASRKHVVPTRVKRIKYSRSVRDTPMEEAASPLAIFEVTTTSMQCNTNDRPVATTLTVLVCIQRTHKQGTVLYGYAQTNPRRMVIAHNIYRAYYRSKMLWCA
ncbi:hypothetical protein ASPTUDRAFT_276005 [Aspergillus tubingensis CBS 134.48]|uniref:Uncharacterized protein n=1 Tax=Aspergillus tubingensis (strain CBS 134.48) TaxID=767770 RepID=A0A1L9NNP9_ASPTC|nr:hypothetical protein ASPTUDRAFT_276005 [Aspergillus tubingensis CBS 134.48]